MASSPRHLANGITSTDHEAAPTPTPVTNGKVPTDSKTHLPNGKTFPYRSPRKPLIDRFIDEPRALRVAVIGGGLAGITAGILLPAKVPNINLTIYDKNADFGGTWLENVYPGVRCDIPSHVYQSTFAPKLDWSDQFSTGAEILAYWQSTARKHDVYQYAEFGSRIVEAVWDAAAGAWTLRVQDVATGAVRLATADFVLTSTGRFNAWKLPAYPGLSEYRGLVRHSSNWDPAFDAAGKTIAVIGNGASGIQLVASLQPSAARLDHYARHPTWIAASWAGDDRTAEPQPIPEPQKASFQDDPATYLAFRKQLEDKYWRRFSSFFRDSESNQDLRRSFIDIMKKRLVKKPELLAHLVPDFSPNCRRLTPGPGYLEAITQDNVEYITAPIRRFTASGIETADGVMRDVDAVFCATGANVDLVPEFPIRAHGQDLREVWAADGEHGFPYTYLGLATPGFPNLLFVHGPHGTGPSGTVPHSVENQLTYFAKVLRKVAREGIRSLAPSARAADDFVAYADDFFATTVLSDPCSSWYNGGRPGGRIHGVWPGSAGHVTIVRREPRWEDWEYEYLAESGNRFSWYFGNGWTRAEGDDDSDMTPYLKLPGTVDLKDIHESWWDIP
ncbi:FAD dependent oxidoreductase [Cordyceps militaris]|uniref:FAD dependent oxidoreductase n=1 Tax=Cordyceps militaris TaxID=73501 RepID=A0A2H4SKA6_CORMI|nr:FAD dependent oxidoreductase [Cordyceps militaris]